MENISSSWMGSIEGHQEPFVHVQIPGSDVALLPVQNNQPFFVYHRRPSTSFGPQPPPSLNPAYTPPNRFHPSNFPSTASTPPHVNEGSPMEVLSPSSEYSTSSYGVMMGAIAQGGSPVFSSYPYPPGPVSIRYTLPQVQRRQSYDGFPGVYGASEGSLMSSGQYPHSWTQPQDGTLQHHWAPESGNHMSFEGQQSQIMYPPHPQSYLPSNARPLLLGSASMHSGIPIVLETHPSHMGLANGSSEMESVGASESNAMHGDDTVLAMDSRYQPNASMHPFNESMPEMDPISAGMASGMHLPDADVTPCHYPLPPHPLHPMQNGNGNWSMLSGDTIGSSNLVVQGSGEHAEGSTSHTQTGNVAPSHNAEYESSGGASERLPDSPDGSAKPDMPADVEEENARQNDVNSGSSKGVSTTPRQVDSVPKKEEDVDSNSSESTLVSKGPTPRAASPRLLLPSLTNSIPSAGNTIGVPVALPSFKDLAGDVDVHFKPSNTGIGRYEAVEPRGNPGPSSGLSDMNGGGVSGGSGSPMSARREIILPTKGDTIEPLRSSTTPYHPSRSPYPNSTVLPPLHTSMQAAIGTAYQHGYASHYHGKPTYAQSYTPTHSQSQGDSPSSHLYRRDSHPPYASSQHTSYAREPPVYHRRPSHEDSSPTSYQGASASVPHPGYYEKSQPLSNSPHTPHQGHAHDPQHHGPHAPISTGYYTPGGRLVPAAFPTESPGHESGSSVSSSPNSVHHPPVKPLDAYHDSPPSPVQKHSNGPSYPSYGNTLPRFHQTLQNAQYYASNPEFGPNSDHGRRGSHPHMPPVAGLKRVRDPEWEEEHSYVRRRRQSSVSDDFVENVARRTGSFSQSGESDAFRGHIPSLKEMGIRQLPIKVKEHEGPLMGAFKYDPSFLPPVHKDEDEDGASVHAQHEPSYSFISLPGNSVRKRPRRKFEEIQRNYVCNHPGCTKAYGTLNHLNAHVLMQKHGSKRTPAEFKEMRKTLRKQKKEQIQMQQPEYARNFIDEDDDRM